MFDSLVIFFSNEWHLSIWNSPCLFRIPRLDHYRFPCSRQAVACVASWNSPLDLIHLFTRALLNSHWLVTLEWKPFLQLILIISKPSTLRPHVCIKSYSFLFFILARSTYIIYSEICYMLHFSEWLCIVSNLEKLVIRNVYDVCWSSK